MEERKEKKDSNWGQQAAIWAVTKKNNWDTHNKKTPYVPDCQDDVAISVKFKGRLQLAPFRGNYAKKNLAGMEMEVAGDCSCRQYVAKRRNPRSFAKMR